MRLGFLVDGKEEYGIARVILDIAMELKDCDVVIISLSDGCFIKEAQAAGLPVHCLNLARPPAAFRSGKVQKLLALYRLERYNRHIRTPISAVMSRLDLDLIVVNYLPHINILPKSDFARAWLMHNDISNGYPFDFNRRIIRSRLRRKRVQPVANSRYIAGRLEMPRLSVPFVHLGVDLDRFRPDRPDFVTREDLGIPRDATVFAIFARLVSEKGQLRFLEALASPEFRSHKPHLILAGGLPIDQTSTQGSYVESLRRHARDCGLNDALHLCGTLEHPERHYGIIDVAVNARLDAEPFGLSIAEALAAGCPVLAHALGGPSEIIIDNQTGWLSQTSTVESFREALGRAFAHRSRWLEMGRAARHHAVSTLARHRAAKRFLDAAMIKRNNSEDRRC